MDKVIIVGVGLLGGSFALALRKKYPAMKFLGMDHNDNHLSIALEKKIIDNIAQEKDFEVAYLVILAIPVNHIPAMLKSTLQKIKTSCIVMDLGSTKEQICKSVAGERSRGRFVAAHHIAGTEYSGPNAAFENLLEHKVMILCDVENSDVDAVETVIKLC